MNVYQTNNDGVFVGITTADQDPMDESNTLIPAGCVETAPPTTTDEQLARWDGTAWAVEDIPTPEAEPEPADPADEARAGRDNILTTVVDPLVSNPFRWADLTSDKQAEWSQYRTDLLSVPQQAGFPNNITWPTKP
tara:strand:+ start:301 stop:708 length:408 start_codon:yes stop_codon:yes gene_type:complete